MAKVSPGRTSFNAGEFSKLVEGRVDLDRYAASMRRMENFIAAPQGPAIRRSGTKFVAPVRNELSFSGFVNFEFNEDQLFLLEFSEAAMRVISEDGVLQKADNTGDYVIVAPYLSASVRSIRSVQSDDVVYLFCDGYPVYKVSRRAATDWRIERVNFINGPFMPVDEKYGRLAFDGTGHVIPRLVSNNSWSGGTAVASGGAAYLAFDQQTETSWGPSAQTGFVGFLFNTPRTINGYVIGAPRGIAPAAGYTSLDYAPATWTFEATNDGTNWIALDAQSDYVLWEGGRSIVFDFNNDTPYLGYRLNVLDTKRGDTNVLLSALTFIEKTPTVDFLMVLSVPGSGPIAFNNYLGFRPTDVGRLFRVKSPADQSYRVVRMTQYQTPGSARGVAVREPMYDTRMPTEWQAGYFSDTTGWPTCGVFFEDRLWVGGLAMFPNLVAGSRVGVYEDFESRNFANEVLDDGALVFLLKARKQSRVRWIEADERGLLVGTGSSEWVISGGTNGEPLKAGNARARPSTQRGSADVEPVRVDKQVLYVQTSKRTIREFAYVYESDGYKSPSMSLFASHIGVERFEELAYSSEPHSIIWARMADGTVSGLTYNRDENVIGWHRHNFGGAVETIATLPSRDGLQDALWLVMRRTVNGQTRRYIERMTRFWDFDSVITEAHFVDSGLSYSGAPTSSVSGLGHLEGRDVVGLADGVPFAATVEDGAVALRDPASRVVVGLPYESFAEISRMEAGSADGTAQGKTKRINNLTLSLWETARGEIGVYNEAREEYTFQDIEYDEAYDTLDPIRLFTGLNGPHVLGGGYGKDGTLAFRQSEPLPFNVIALLPQLTTQDR